MGLSECRRHRERGGGNFTVHRHSLNPSTCFGVDTTCSSTVICSLTVPVVVGNFIDRRTERPCSETDYVRYHKTYVCRPRPSIRPFRTSGTLTASIVRLELRAGSRVPVLVRVAPVVLLYPVQSHGISISSSSSESCLDRLEVISAPSCVAAQHLSIR